MDLSRPESSDLSLGFHSLGHARGHAVTGPLRLFDDMEDAKPEMSVGGGGGGGGGGGEEEDGEEGGDQHFSLLGRPPP
jgi:glycine hydroxymethyltransferase